MISKKSFSNFKYKVDSGQIVLTISTKIYPPEAVYQTGYLFLADYYVYLDGDPAKEIKVILKSKNLPVNLLEAEAVVGKFYNELLNQLLRIRVSQTNAKIREYIVAQALYNALPKEVDELLQEVTEEDWQKDPLGIAKPWQENQAEDKKTAKKKK